MSQDKRHHCALCKKLTIADNVLNVPDVPKALLCLLCCKSCSYWAAKEL